MTPFYYIERQLISCSQDERKNGKCIVNLFSKRTGKLIEERRYYSKSKAFLYIMTQKKRWKEYEWNYKLTKETKKRCE